MATISGVVKAKSSNRFGHGMLIEDKWYNSKFPIDVEKGDTVEFDDGGKNYIKGLKKFGSGATSNTGSSAPVPGGVGGRFRGAFPIPPNDGSRSIVRQNSVTNAVNLVSAMLAAKRVKEGEDLVSHVFAIAREFEKYSAGDIDAEIEAELDKGFTVE